MEIKNVIDALEKARNISKHRNFVQSWDLIINLKGLDLKKPENRLNFEFVLPENAREKTKTLFIGNELIKEAKGKFDLVLTKEELEGLDKKTAKKYANIYDIWFAEASIMPLVGKMLGPILGPRNKIPKPIPPKAKIEPFIANVNKLVRVRIKESPVIQLAVGNELMDNDKVAKNIVAMFNHIIERLPKGRANIKNVYIKLTMGKPIKVKI